MEGVRNIKLKETLNLQYIQCFYLTEIICCIFMSCSLSFLKIVSLPKQTSDIFCLLINQSTFMNKILINNFTMRAADYEQKINFDSPNNKTSIKFEGNFTKAIYTKFNYN